MDKLKLLNRVKRLYSDNGNIIKYLRELGDGSVNSAEDVMISYDFQAGSYIKGYKEDPDFKQEYCNYLAEVLENLCEFNSLLEVGVGEATTLAPLLAALKNRPKMNYGFDISWSRIKYAKRFLEELNISNVSLFTGDLFCTPLKNNSIDIVFTSHSIEPNGGREKEALKELYRIAKKYLVLLEPAYEFSSDQARERMLKHGYVTQLYSVAKKLGYKIIEHRLFDTCVNALNPTGLIIIEKNANDRVDDPLCCPLTKTDLCFKDNAYFSAESLLAYPVISDIPCLLPQNAIVATKFLD
ncbi:methyltransferase domain-containing protein [Desulfitobacterium sp. AusDCA]|uniref:methyltransferase domain-containing protein n=1 Tax=Desulfitobacterium sp. AusDCA TaxID=3240383 RepID=UPI003DA75DB3